MLGHQPLDPRGQLRHLLLGLAGGRKRDDPVSGLPEQVGQDQERFAGADVGGDDGAPPGVDVEERRLAPPFGLAGGLEDLLSSQQIVDDQADGAAHAYGARQVGARDGLVRAHQVQHDAVADVAAGAAVATLKRTGDSAH
jgi:hypothetical protein